MKGAHTLIMAWLGLIIRGPGVEFIGDKRSEEQQYVAPIRTRTS